jgi:hypothetical protein
MRPKDLVVMVKEENDEDGGGRDERGEAPLGEVVGCWC